MKRTELQKVADDVMKRIKKRKIEKEQCKLRMANTIINYVLLAHHPPTAEQLINFIESKGGTIT